MSIACGFGSLRSCTCTWRTVSARLCDGKLGKNASEYYGPFASRVAAEKFANDSLDFFKMRRCVEELNPILNFRVASTRR